MHSGDDGDNEWEEGPTGVSEIPELDLIPEDGDDESSGLFEFSDESDESDKFKYLDGTKDEVKSKKKIIHEAMRVNPEEQCAFYAMGRLTADWHITHTTTIQLDG